MIIDELVAAVPGAFIANSEPASSSRDVTAIDFDSLAVRPGSMFCCLRGAAFDGHDFAGAAVDSGAVAIMVDHRVDELVALGVTLVVVPDVRVAMAPLAAHFYGHPSSSVTVIGVTGTNGKTTVTHLLKAIFDEAGLANDVIGTLSGARTTPEAPELQRKLASLRDDGIRIVAMEVSSHALMMHRVDNCHFAVAVFTNLSREHLDFHTTMEAYFEAKAQLFEPRLASQAVVNADSPYGRLLSDAAKIPTTSFAIADVVDLEFHATGSNFTWRGQRVSLNLGGSFNVANALAAGESAVALGVDPEVIAAGLSRPMQIPGRFELIDVGQPFQVIVDYAHTPDGLEQVLAAVQQVHPDDDVTVVFGCGGDRDAAKRAGMGSVAARLADRVILTSDNSRSEDTGVIIDAVRMGYEQSPDRRSRELVIEPNRRTAIAKSVALAVPNSVVVIAGKGHERTQIIGDSVVPFDDREVARGELQRMLGMTT